MRQPPAEATPQGRDTSASVRGRPKDEICEVLKKGRAAAQLHQSSIADLHFGFMDRRNSRRDQGPP